MSHCAGDGTIRKGPPKVPADCRGTPLRPDEFEADAQRVAAVYSSFGFPHVDATVELGFGERGPILRVSVFPVDDGPEGRREPTPGNVRPLRIGEIFLEGNLLTERNVLLREMGLGDVRPGDRLDPTKIEAGVGRLRRTGLYSRVDLDYIGIADGDDRAHLRIAVEERPSTTVDLSAGFSTQQLLSIRLEGRNRNLFGTMFDGSVGVDFGLFIGRFSQVRSQIRWPRMLGSNVSLSLTPVALSYRDDPAGVFLFTPSTLAGQKAAAAWERPDTRRRLFTLGSSLSLDWRAEGLHPKIDNKLTIGAAVEARGDWLDLAGTPFAPFSRDALATVDGLLELLQNHDPSQVVAFTPRVAWSDIDNPFDPKEGLGAEFFYRGVPFALVPYGVLGAQTRGYWTFGDRLTLATGVRLRWGMAAGVPNRCLASDPQSCAWALMQNDLLRPGGERTVRAVQEGGIGVHGVQYDSQLVPVFQAGQPLVGVRPGLFGAVANVELRYSLIRQFFLGELKPAVFADLGVSTDDLSFELGDALTDPRYALSVGAGLRYVLPVGPLSFDVAWSPLARTGTGAPFQVHVVLGYIF